MATTRRETAAWGRAVLLLPLLQLFLVASLSLCLTTCGIETVTTFQPPGFLSPSTNLLQLTHNTINNDTSLKGYEIYYRAFDTQTSADAARSAIEQAAAATTATPESCLALMQSSGFTRVFDADGNDGPNGIRPLFPVPSLTTAIQYTFVLDSNNPPSTAVDSQGNLVSNYQTVAYWYYYPTSTPSIQIGVTRSISTASVPISFESNYRANGDTDYTGAGKGSIQSLYFVFFAIAYGIDTSSSSFSPIYSLPTSLYTSLQYTLPQQIQ